MEKSNFYSYEISFGKKSGNFNIYQDRSGAICISMDSGYIRLTPQQVESLGINVYDLIDFDIDDFRKCYAIK